MRWSDFVKPTFNRDFPPSQISYWQVGHNDFTSGRGYNQGMSHANGYDNGYRCAMGRPRSLASDASYFMAPEPVHQNPEMPDPPLMNPYMEAMENIEGVLKRLQTFTKEFPFSVDREKVADYTANLLRIRDDLSALRQQEMRGA
jgi:hypothetical protein